MKFLPYTLAALLAAGFLGSTSSSLRAAPSKGTVGISMPTKTSLRWINDGDNMVAALKAKGYGVDLQYADDDIPNQLSQIENMVTKGVKVLVIAAVDGSTLSKVLQSAAEAKIKVISYDRLLTGTLNVDAWPTFDNAQVGVFQAQAIVDKLGLKDGKGPFNIELFGGSPDDPNAFFFYDGAMSVLQPYIDSKKLVVQSGQMGMKTIGTLRWEAATAQSRMDNILSSSYTNKKLDAVLSPNDTLAIGIISSLKGVGYGGPNQPMPIITGQDAETPSVKAILAGDQYCTVFKDTRQLANLTASIVDSLLTGSKVEGVAVKPFNNKAKDVPCYQLNPILVTKDNVQKVLVDSGYIKASALK